MKYGSVCSGIEAATAAWHPLGWQPAFFSEIDAFPRAVLAHHYPHVPLHGDFTTIREGDYAAIDLLVGGTPCQSFSVAGLRKGLDDDRGNLALEFCRLALRLRPKWVVWENVPGVLSMDGGRAFASILGGLAECGYGLAYRVLDAQFVRVDGFGRAVPQRRRRVFVVGCAGDWRRAAAVLFERASLSGNPAPRREAWQKPAATLGTSAARRRGLDDRGDVGANLITHAIQAGALRENPESGPDGVGVQEGIAYTIEARAEVQAVCFGGNNQSGPIDVATAQTAQTAHGGTGRIDFESETFVAHALRADGFDASEDGTGRGTPLVPVAVKVAPCLRAGGNVTGGDRPYGTDVDTCESLVAVPQGVALRGREGGATAELTGDVMTSLRTGGGGGDKPHVLLPTICFSAKDHGADAMEQLSPTLRAGGFDKSHANAGVMPAIAFNARQDPDVFDGHTGPLDTDGSTQGILSSWRVRRLTPL